MIEMQVVCIEHGYVHQTVQVGDVQLLALKLDEFVPAQFLKRAIDVNRGQASCIRDIDLG